MARTDAQVLAIIGSGVQARSHLEAIRHVRLTAVRVWSPNAEHCDQFAREMTCTAAFRLERRRASSAVREADIVVAPAPHPVIAARTLARHTSARVGACRPTHREMSTSLMTARVIVTHAGAVLEAGDLSSRSVKAPSPIAIAGELGEVVLGQCVGRRHDDEITVFKSLGMAVEDIVAARLAVDRAEAAGLGQRFSLQ
jgi:ornithine cyclodeaminase